MRAWSMRLAAVFAAVLTALLATTAYAWETEQQALNSIREDNTVVLLRKLEKTADGTVTEKTLPGAAFLLHRVDGTQLGGPYTTDEKGEIRVELPPGAYYFTETAPPDGYTYDWDEAGNTILHYPFTVAEPEEGKKSEEAQLVLAYNRKLISVDVTLPTVEKRVEGQDVPREKFTFILEGLSDCPMPEAAAGTTWLVSRIGEGPATLGEVTFYMAGDYTYTIREAAGEDGNWQYDEAVYTLTVRIREKDGALLCDGFDLKKDGMPASGVVFTNRYVKKDLSETVIVSGQKTWDHGADPQANWPDHIVVKLYADGVLFRQCEASESTAWQYSFEVPRYTAAGQEIQYTVDEDAVEGYSRRVSGWDITNTYVGTTAAGTQKPPKTGDEFSLALWVTLGLIGAGGLAVTLVLLCRGSTEPHPWRKKKDTGGGL